jgi:hypothetical protein
MAEFCVDSGMCFGNWHHLCGNTVLPGRLEEGEGPQLRHFDRGSVKLKREVDYDRLARIISCIPSCTSANHRDPMQVSRNS